MSPLQNHDLFYQDLSLKVRQRIVEVQKFLEQKQNLDTEIRYYLLLEIKNLFQLLELIGEEACIIPF